MCEFHVSRQAFACFRVPGSGFLLSPNAAARFRTQGSSNWKAALAVPHSKDALRRLSGRHPSHLWMGRFQSILLTLVLGLGIGCQTESPPGDRDWPVYKADSASSSYSPVKFPISSRTSSLEYRLVIGPHGTQKSKIKTRNTELGTRNSQTPGSFQGARYLRPTSDSALSSPPIFSVAGSQKT